MLYFHHADQLEPLLSSLADVLAVAPGDPFAAELVVVPTVGMADAAMSGLGRLLGSTGTAGDGIVANVEFVFPGQFVARALGQAPGHGVEHDPWHVSSLTWAVLDVLADDGTVVPGPNRQRTERWALARHLADLFDRYATQRPDVITAWAAGRDEDGTGAALPAGHLWQPELWRRVRRRIGVPSPPEQFPTLVADLRVGRVEPHLPARVSLFGFGAVPPSQLRLLQALGAVRDVHVFLRHPSSAAWDAVDQGLGGRLVPRADEDVTAGVGHPLLASWGRPSLETRTLLVGVTGIEWRRSSHASAAQPTVLGALQAGIRRAEAPELASELDPADATVQVHACHGETRQVEALRDALGHAFVADPTLAAHDVLVLCPDLDRFAPLIEAVFARGGLPVPVRIGDRSLSTAEPIVEAVEAVLALVSGRATLSEMLRLVQFEPVRRRFGWDLDDVEQLAAWCSEVGARWGLEADHRAEWELPATLQAGTWRSFVDRLLAGSALPAPSPRLVLGGVAPYDTVGADDMALVGTVADLVARLVDLHRRVRDDRPVGEWITVLRSVIDDFCATAPDEAWRRHAVLSQLDRIRSASELADGSSEVALTLADVRAMLADGLHDRPGRLPLRSGAVTVSSLVPQTGVPARVVCVLGLDDGVLRGGSFDGDDVLGVHPCVGERHPRFESRQLLLDAVLSARERLLVTCNGSDITTNKPVPFTVPLVELLDVVGRLVELDGRGGPVVVHHPRHGFDERTLRSSFDPAMLEAARVKRMTAATTGIETTGQTGDRWVLSPAPVDEVEFSELTAVIRNPAEVYLRDRLDVRLPGEPDELDDGLPVSIGGLHKSQLGRQLLAHLGSGGDTDGWIAAVGIDGSLPPGALGAASLTQVTTTATRVYQAATECRVPVIGPDALDVAQELTVSVAGVERRVALSGVVGGLVISEATGRVVDVRFDSTKPTHRLLAALRLAALQRVRPDLEWSATLIAKSESGTKPTIRHLTLRDDPDFDSSLRLLEMGLGLLSWARHDAVPFFVQTSLCLAQHDLSKARTRFGKEFEYDPHGAVLWSETSFDGLLHRHVPERLRWLPDATDGLLLATASWVWDTYFSTIVDRDPGEGR